MGAHEVFDASHNLKEQLLEAHPKRFHLTIDATGNPRAQEQMLGFTRSGGRFLLFGVAAPADTMTVEPYDIFYRELKIVGVHSFGDKFGRAVGIVKSRRVNLAEIISHHFPLAQFRKVLDLTRSPEPSLKILMHPDGDAQMVGRFSNEVSDPTKATNRNEQRWFAVLRYVGRRSKECKEWIR